MTTPKLAASLLEKYGALMTASDLAELLGTTQKRISNGFANNLPWCRPFQRARIKIGRRVHLNTATIAEILEELQAAGADFPAQHLCIRCGDSRDPLAGAQAALRAVVLELAAFWQRSFGGGSSGFDFIPVRP